MPTRLTRLALVAVALLAACSTSVSEPWVNSEQDLREERMRTDAETKSLRDRLAETQIDR